MNFWHMGSHQQEIHHSPHITAVIEVVHPIRQDSIDARSSLLNEPILIEFEHAVRYSAGERVLIVGSLDLHEAPFRRVMRQK